jgi:hypothetical protein
MPSSPSIVPEIVCLVLDDFGPTLGRAWRETDVEDTDLETVMADLLDGQFGDPVRVVAFNTAQGWSRDISNVVAVALRIHCEHQGRKLPESMQQFVERYESAKA